MRELVFGVLGGTALLMFGVEMMSEALERSAGNLMKSILLVLTGNTVRAMLVSTAVTALVQSSTAITVLTVGFVNAGFMNLRQALGVIYGANIGTTVTAQLMAFKLTHFALLFFALGFTARLLASSERIRRLGEAVMGFGLMFLGLKVLHYGVPYLQQQRSFEQVLLVFSREPLLALLAGAFSTMLVHSSSATVAVTMVLAKAGLIDLRGAICIMLGDNIGTCVTAQLASLNKNVSARRTAWAHSLYNVIGALGALIVLPLFVRLVAATSTDPARQIANAHTIFNVFSAIVFLPLTCRYADFLEWLIPESGNAPRSSLLDSAMLKTPSAALTAAKALTAMRMKIREAAAQLEEMAGRAFGLVVHFDDRSTRMLSDTKTSLNLFQKSIAEYVMQLEKKSLTGEECRLSLLCLQLADLMRQMGDHVEQVGRLAGRKFDQGVKFGPPEVSGLNSLGRLVCSALGTLERKIRYPVLDCGDTLKDPSPGGREARRIRTLVDELRQSHLLRLRSGRCPVDASIIYLDLLAHAKAIAGLIEDLEAIL